MSKLPKYFRKNTSVKTIDIQGEEWFDKVNGDSYNAVQVTVNHGLKNEFTFSIPFQYGYGSYFKQSAFEHLVKMGALDKEYIRNSSEYNPEKNKFIVRDNIERNCLKRDVVLFGKMYCEA